MALLLASMDAGLAWALWLGYHLVAASIIVVVFVQGARRAGPSVHASKHTDVML